MAELYNWAFLDGCLHMTPKVHVTAEGVEAVAVAAANLVMQVVESRVNDSGTVHIALTGGRAGTRTTELFTELCLAGATPLGGVHLWWGDERWTPHDQSLRNDFAVLGCLEILQGLGAIAHPVRGDTIETAVDLYREALREHNLTGSAARGFDLVLLGVGEDGHVASLFPASDELDTTNQPVVPVFDSPKPPGQRITLTLPQLNAARRIVLMIAGSEKAAAALEAVNRTIRIPDAIPAARIEARNETLVVCDKAAAMMLTDVTSVPAHWKI